MNIRRHMEDARVKPSIVCDALKIPFPTFSDWINAKTYPRIDKIEMLANYFGVMKSSLVEKHCNEHIKSLEGFDPELLRFAAAGELTPENKEIIINMARMLHERQQKGS